MKELDVKEALKHIREHFTTLTTKQFLANMKKYCPELLEELSLDTTKKNLMIKGV